MPSYNLAPSDAGTRVKIVGAAGDVDVLVGDRSQTWTGNIVIEVVNDTDHTLTFVPDDSVIINALTGAVNAAGDTAGILTLKHGEYGRLCQLGNNQLHWDLHVYQTDPLTNVDVTTTPPTTGQVLEFDGTNWVPSTPAAPGATALSGLTDVDTTTSAPTSGQVLEYNGTKWVNTALPAPAAISNLTDVDVASNAPTNGQTLMFISDTSKWTNESSYLGNQTNATTLADVDVTTNPPDGGQVLIFTGTVWQSQLPQLSNLSDVNTAETGGPAGGQVLQYVAADNTWENSYPANIKPVPYTVDTNAGPTYGFGSSLQHNLYVRSTDATDYTVAVRLDSVFIGTDTFNLNDYNPLNAGPMPVGGFASFKKQGTGNVVFVPDVGVTINTPGTLTISTAFGKATLIKVGPNEWDLDGNV